MSEKLPVIAAVPNYNMADSLKELVPSLLEGGYDDIYVLDDASTDHSRDVLEGFETDITPVFGRENVGSGANRNRIIAALGHKATVHFIDADMKLETNNPAANVREWMDRPDIGFTGGLIKNLDGSQQLFNYGPRQCFYTDSRWFLLMGVHTLSAKRPELTKKLLGQFSSSLNGWPNPYDTPTERQVFWAAEANFAIDSEVLEKLGGFDSNMRAQEILEFSMRVRSAGLNGWFNPNVAATHKALQVRSGNRSVSDVKNMAYTIRKHGLRNYVKPEGKFKPQI